jgi:hypothetical protein
MKNRKIVVIAFTLIAVLLLGVGYAAVTDDLKILGHVKTNMETITSDFQLDVRFRDGSGTIIKDDTNPTSDPTFIGRAHAKVDSVNDTSMDTAVITIENFTATGQTVQALFTIVNFSTDFAAEIAPNLTATFEATGEGEAHTPVFSMDWEWFDVEEEKGTGGQDPVVLTAWDGVSEDTVDAAVILVTITLVDAPDEEHAGTFTLGITATAQ